MMEWTEERINVIRRMAADDRSASEIALAIGDGCTRNMVIGKARRSKIALSPPKQAAERRRSPRRKSKRKLWAEIIHSVNPTSTPFLPPFPLEDEPLTTTKPVPLMRLEADQCHYIVTDDKPWLYCGQPIGDSGTPYCSRHYKNMHAQQGERR